MKNVRISVSHNPVPESGGGIFSKIGAILLIVGLIGLVLCMLPIFLIYFLYTWINSFFSEKVEIKIAHDWREILFKKDFRILMKEVDHEEVPETISEWFTEQYWAPDEGEFFKLKSEPAMKAFEGYTLEEPFEVDYEGLLFTKINMNAKGKVLGYPLYFYEYITGEVTEIVDLNGYYIDETIGDSGDLMIRVGKRYSDESIEINVYSKSQY